MAAILKGLLLEELKPLMKLKSDKLIERRIEKFSKMGVYVG
jgi:acetyl-CoA carboxylase alpha subunit